MTHDQSYPEITSACAQFVMWALMEGSWQGADVDGGDAQDKAASLGLISEVPYDPEKHGSSDGLEPGESWYVPTDELLALLRMSQPASDAQPARCCAHLWVCTGCGTRKSMEQIKGETPHAIACCPERHMAPAVSSTPRESLIGGTNFCGHGMMASLCPTCSVSSPDRGTP